MNNINSNLFKAIIIMLLLAAISPASATYNNESIEMVTFPIGEVSYKAFVYSADMCNALDCYRAWETAL